MSDDTFKYYEVNFEGPDADGGSDILVWGWATHQDAFDWALPLLGKTPTEIHQVAERTLLPTDDGCGDDIPMTRFVVVGRLSVPDDVHPTTGITTTRLKETT